MRKHRQSGMEFAKKQIAQREPETNSNDRNKHKMVQQKKKKQIGKSLFQITLKMKQRQIK